MVENPDFLLIFEVIQKVHFRGHFGTNVVFVWFFLNPFYKGRNKVFTSNPLSLLSLCSWHKAWMSSVNLMWLKISRGFEDFWFLTHIFMYCRGMEGSNNPPKLRRNASTASDMSSDASQSSSTNPGYTSELSRRNSWIEYYKNRDIYVC